VEKSKMPWKNPGCPKCHSPPGHGGVKQIKMLTVTQTTDFMEYGRALFKCKWCGFEFEDWGHRRRKK